MSARARKRQKDTIAGLTSQIQDYIQRNGHLEQLSQAFASVSSALAEENRRLRQYIMMHPHSPGSNQPLVAPQGDSNLQLDLASILSQLTGTTRNAAPSQNQEQHAAIQRPIPQLPVQAPMDFLPATVRMVSPAIQQVFSSPYEGQQAANPRSVLASIPEVLLAQLLANRRASAGSTDSQASGQEESAKKQSHR